MGIVVFAVELENNTHYFLGRFFI